jgi:hypothetical protein
MSASVLVNFRDCGIIREIILDDDVLIAICVVD